MATLRVALSCTIPNDIDYWPAMRKPHLPEFGPALQVFYWIKLFTVTVLRTIALKPTAGPLFLQSSQAST